MQHFLLQAKARTISLKAVFTMGEAKAYETFRQMRWSETDGEGATVHADEGSAWDALHASYETGRVNHSFRYMDKGVCTNQAESYFSRLRRMEIGTHHHVAGPYLNAYAGEASWREDNRRVANGGQAAKVGVAALTGRVSRQWAGYWQRAA